MALQWKWNNKMGSMTVVQTRDGKTHRYTVNIYACNAIAAFIQEWKDENGKEMYNVWSFWVDKQHVKNIVKNCGNVFCGETVTNIRLNMYYKYAAKQVLDILLKNGYKVTCYYKEPKQRKEKKQ